MADINEFCERMRYGAEEGNLGYSQPDRGNITEGGNCDCSSLVIFALEESGFDTGDATYTGDMSDNLCQHGGFRIPNDGCYQVGDILLNDVKHVAVGTQGGLIQASQSETGGIEGQPGDQTGNEVFITAYYDYPGDCYLRYGGEQPQPTPGDGGDYVCVCDCCNVRSEPSLSGEVVAQYHRGECVILDDNFIDADGGTGGTYIAYSGNRRYIAIRNSEETLGEKC